MPDCIRPEAHAGRYRPRRFSTRSAVRGERYASHAVLAWLLGEEAGPRVRQLLAAANIVVASDLTVIECRRG